jgi:DNA polymerase elongation subunit (family B)
MYAYQQKMFMKRETIANKAIWKAKKMYILNALDIEGIRFSEPQLKIQGIEAVRSSTPKACRTSIKEAIKIIMNKDEPSLHEYIANFKTNFMNMPFEDIAFPRGMKGLDVYKDNKTIYSKGTPIHVRGALLYNNYINKNGLGDDFKLIGNGDKIKFAYLKLPNHFRENVISVPDELPKELGLDKYIDYDIQLQKSFIEPIKSILETIGWEVEKTSTLESFFN